MIAMLLRLLLMLSVSGAAASIARSQGIGSEADDNVPLSPEMLGNALSCRSHAALGAFASALFLERKPPAWMREIKDDEETESMIGLEGFRLAKPVSFLGTTVDTVYFLQDWVVTLWPRDEAAAFIKAQRMERAPIDATEQYYRFVDPENGPMLGAFEPTGGSLAAFFAKAVGAEDAPPAPPSDRLFVGCNYAPASQADFLEAAARSEAMLGAAAEDISEVIGSMNAP